MHRPTLGALAVLFLVGALVLWLVFPQHAEKGIWILIRIGAMFGVLWLAHPQLERVPRFLWIGIFVTAVVLGVRPKLLPVVLLILIAIAILRPRRGRGASAAQPRKPPG